MKEYKSNDPILKGRRRELRSKQTETEKLVWELIRARKFNNHRFVRQYSIGPYILDFYCPKLKIAIELDGPIHTMADTKLYDQERTVYLEGFGIQVIRYRNQDVLKNPNQFLSSLSPLLSIREG